MRCTSASEPTLGGPEWSEELRREDENGMTHLRQFCFDGLLLFYENLKQNKKSSCKEKTPWRWVRCSSSVQMELVEEKVIVLLNNNVIYANIVNITKVGLVSTLQQS